MKVLTHIIRIKRFEPLYELYKVIDGKIIFSKETNNYSEIGNNLNLLRIVLSSAICADGDRSIPNEDKNFKVDENIFYFSHKIISNIEDLKFSPAKIYNNKLRQIWVDKRDYLKLVEPLIELYQNRIENIISEKSTFIIHKNNELDLVDGNVVNTFRLNADETFDVSLKREKSISNVYKSLNNVSLNRDVSTVTNFRFLHKKNIYTLSLLILLFFIFLNFIIILPKFSSIQDLKVSYFFNNFGLKKIDNAQEMIQQNKIINENLKREIPSTLSKVNLLFDNFPKNLMQDMLDFRLLSNGEVLIKFGNNIFQEIIKFMDKNEQLNINIEVEDNIILMRFNINNY